MLAGPVAARPALALTTASSPRAHTALRLRYLRFTCDCVAGWRGTTCGTDWNECIMGIHQCNDDATDLNDVDLGRMWGTLKENAGCYDYPDCSEEPCQHGGTCTEGPDGCEELNVEQEDVMVDRYSSICAYSDVPSN